MLRLRHIPLVLIAVLAGTSPVYAVGAKPNKAALFTCLDAHTSARGDVVLAPCVELLLAPCGRWFKTDTIDLYSSCLRGLGGNWSGLLRAGLQGLDERLGAAEQRDIEARVTVWREGLRRHCRALPKLQTRSVHLRGANRRACALGVNAVLTYMIEKRPRDLIGDPPVEA